MTDVLVKPAIEEGVRLDFRGKPIPPESERDPDQWWFWTPKWQQMEREADEDIAAGRTTFYPDTESFLASFGMTLADLENLPAD
jgi:hypothetical protein